MRRKETEIESYSLAFLLFESGAYSLASLEILKLLFYI